MQIRSLNALKVRVIRLVSKVMLRWLHVGVQNGQEALCWCCWPCTAALDAYLGPVWVVVGITACWWIEIWARLIVRRSSWRGKDIRKRFFFWVVFYWVWNGYLHVYCMLSVYIGIGWLESAGTRSNGCIREAEKHSYCLRCMIDVQLCQWTISCCLSLLIWLLKGATTWICYGDGLPEPNVGVVAASTLSNTLPTVTWWNQDVVD